MMLVDSVILILVILSSFAVRSGYWFWPDLDLYLLIFGAPCLAVPIFFIYGHYHSVSRFFGGEKALWSLFKAVSLYSLIWGLLVFMSGIDGIPRSVILINWLIAFICIGGVRFFA